MDIWSLFMTFKNWRWSSAVVILLLVHDWSGLVGAEQSIEVIVKWAAGNTCHNILNEAWCCRDAPAYIFCSSPAKITSSLLDFIVSEYEMQNSPFSLKSWLVLQCLSVVIFQPSLGVCVLNVCNCGLYFFFWDGSFLNRLLHNNTIRCDVVTLCCTACWQVNHSLCLL